MAINIDWLRRNGHNPRVHGNGFVQFDLPNQSRLHIFGHPAVPRQTSPTPIHDHAWGFTSKVLAGALVNLDWLPTVAARPTHFVCSYEPSTAGGEDTRLIPSARVCGLHLLSTRVVLPGQSYKIEPAALHETFANEPTVTLMAKSVSLGGYKPRVLCALGREPDNSFVRHEVLSMARIWEIAEDALRGV